MSLKYLVIRFSSIGDIVLTTPVLRNLANQTGAEIHFLTKPSFESIIAINPYVSKVWTLEEDFDKMVIKLRAEKFDHIIDLHHNLRTRRIKAALKIPSHSFHKLNFEKWLMVNFKINRLPDRHIVDRYMDTVEFLNIVNDEEGLDFFIPEHNKVDIKERFGFESNAFVSIVIGATYNTKCLTADQISEIVLRLNRPVVLLGGKAEVDKANLILESVKSSLLRSSVGQMDLFESASVLQQSSAIISHDTGLMHIAAALKKSQTVIWGNTVPEFGMYPYYGTHDIKWHSFEIKHLKCRPCSKLGYDRCPKKHFRCILDLDLQQIVDSCH